MIKKTKILEIFNLNLEPFSGKNLHENSCKNLAVFSGSFHEFYMEIALTGSSCLSYLALSNLWLFDLVTSCFDTQTDAKSQKYQITKKNFPKEVYNFFF